jgi:HlyD family secretion protein
MKWGRAIVLGIAVAAVAAGLWWAFLPQPIAVDTATVGTGDMVVTVDEVGLARIRDVYEVSAPVAGELLRLPVAVGDTISADAVVATIVPQESALLDLRARAEAEAALRAAGDAVVAAQSDLALAQSERDYWQEELRRKESMEDRGIGTLQAVQQARLELSRREAMITSATALLGMRRHQLQQAEARLNGPALLGAGSGGRRDVLAPAAGQVLQVSNQSGRSVAAGAPIMEIGGPEDLKIVVDLLSTDAVRSDVGPPPTVSGWGGESELKAQVARIEPTGFTKVSALGVEEQRVPVHLDLLDPPEERPRLGHLYRVFVQIEVLRVPSAVLVPTSALFRTGNAWSVFLVEDGRARLQPIRLGARNAQVSEVLEGVQPGVSVILHPSDLLADGSMVESR